MFAYMPAAIESGAGFAVVTDRFLCLLGPEAAIAGARELYDLLEVDQTELNDVLDHVTARHNLEHFAIVELLDARSRSFRVAMRGAIAVDLEQATATRLSGTTNAAWLSTEARGVNSLRLALDSAGAEVDPLPIRRGIVVAHAVSLDTPVKGAPASPMPQELLLKTQPITLPRLDEIQRDAERRQPAPPDDGKPSLKRTKRVALPLVEQGSLVRWLLVLPDGSEIDARVPVVIGRRPWPVETDEKPAAYVVASSPRREISASHLEISIVDGVLQGRDLDSTNGTIIRTPSRPPRLLHRGCTSVLVSGDILDVGEDYSIVVKSGL